MGRRTKWTLALLATGALALGWITMTNDSSTARSEPNGPNPVTGAEPEPHSQPRQTTPNPPEVAAPDATVAPADRTESGARTSAVAYLELTEDAVAMTPTEAGAVQRSIAAVEFADEFGADGEQRMIELQESIPGGIILRVAPIEVRSIADGDDWLVSVWYAQTITIVGETVIDDWRTADYRMRWEDNAWKIAAFSSERGPMPGRGSQPASATAVDFESHLAGYSDEGLG